jgi:hypothetical protein
VRSAVLRGSDKHQFINSRAAACTIASGSVIELTESGSFRVPQPTLAAVNHLQTSRAVNKVALEYELIEIARRQDWKTAREAVKRAPSINCGMFATANHSSYRPYGIEVKGATRVSIIPCRFESDPNGTLITPPSFTGYLIGLPDARFSCTIAENPLLLRYMLDRIESTEACNYLTTRKIFWSH